MGALTLLIVASVAAAASRAGATPTSAASAPPTNYSSAPACTAADVHAPPVTPVQVGAPKGLPWISAGRRAHQIVGYLFYYADRSRPTGSRWTIWAGGESADSVATKILWAMRKGTATALSVVGTRLDAVGSFRDRFASIGGGMFPSIVVVPQAGCWRLTLRAGRSVVRFAVLAVPPGG